MPTQVDIDGVGRVEFPDGMSDGDILNAIHTRILPQSTPQPQSNVLINSQSGQPNWSDPNVVMEKGFGFTQQPSQAPSLPVMQLPQKQRNDNYAGKGDPNALTRPLVPVSLINNPQTISDGLINSLGKGLASLTSPLAIATTPAMMAKPLQIPLTAMFGGMGAKGVGEGLGEQFAGPSNGLGLPTLTQGLNPAQRAEGFGDIAQQALMTAAPVAHVMTGFTPPEATQQGPMPLDPDTTNFQTFQTAKAQGKLAPPPVEVGGNLGTPNPFDKGKVMPNSLPVEVPPSVPLPPSASVPVPPKATAPLSDYDQYQVIQQQMMTHPFGSPEFVDAWKQNEIVKNRNGGMPPTKPTTTQTPSEPSQSMLPQPSAATVPAPAVAAPVSTPESAKPATKIGDEVIAGEHGKEQAQFMQAQQRNPNAPVVRGFVDSTGKFYNTPMEVSREIQLNQQLKDNNANQQQSGQSAGISQSDVGQATSQGGEKMPELQTGKTVPSVQQEKDGQTYGALSEEKPGQQSGDAATNESVSDAKQQSVGLSARAKIIEQQRLKRTINGESGSILNPLDIGKAVIEEVRQRLSNLKDSGKSVLDAVMDTSAWKAGQLKRQGYDLSRIESLSPELANHVARYANSATAALLRGQVNLNEVFRDKIKDEQFRKQLGGLVFEDMRKGSGDIGNSVLSLKNSPFKDQAQLDAFKKRTDVKETLERWKELIQKPATEMHQKLNGGMAATGKETGAYANLIAVLKDKPNEEQLQSSPRVGPLATMKKGSAFSRERQFSGSEYNLDAADMGLRMMTKNDAEFQKRNVYDALEKSGLGKMLKPGEDVPEGMVKKPNPVTLRSIITKNPDGTTDSAAVSRFPAWSKKIDGEMEQALQLNTNWKDQINKAFPVTHALMELATKVQVAAMVDLGFHSVNDTIATMMSGKGLLALPQKAAASLKAVNDLVSGNPKLVEELAKAAEQGVTFRGKSLGGFTSKILSTVDTTTRVVLNREYDDMVKAGKVIDSPAERRRFVNGSAGQYNKRFMSYFDQTMQEIGVGPFVTAGKNFNRLSTRLLTMSPGVKATSGVEALRMRASIAAGVAMFVLAAPALVNIAVTGQPKPPGFEYGDVAIPGTKNPDGTMKKLNLRKWALVDRMGRITGLADLMQQQILPRIRGEQPGSLKSTAWDMMKDIVKGKSTPYAGPPVNIASTLASGKSAMGFEQRTPGEKAPYVKAAVGALNPLMGSAINDVSPAKTVMGEVGKVLLAKGEDITGVKNSSTPLQTMYAQASRFKQSHGIADDPSSYAPSEYVPLKKALVQGDVDTAKAVYQQLVDEKAKAYFTKDPDAAKLEAQKVVQQEFQKLENFRFINKQDEPSFRASLTPEQRTTYDAAIAQQKQMADTFFSQVQPKIVVPKKGPFQLQGIGGLKGIKGF